MFSTWRTKLCSGNIASSISRYGLHRSNYGHRSTHRSFPAISGDFASNPSARAFGIERDSREVHDQGKRAVAHRISRPELQSANVGTCPDVVPGCELRALR